MYAPSDFHDPAISATGSQAQVEAENGSAIRDNDPVKGVYRRF
jgi:hypothetical protein